MDAPLPDPLPDEVSSRRRFTAAAAAAAAVGMLGGRPAGAAPGESVAAPPAGATVYPPAPAERAAGVRVVQPWYPHFTPDRYGVNATPGTTDMYGAIQAANDAAAVAGAPLSFVPGERYGVDVSAHGQALSLTTDWLCDGPRATIVRIDFATATAFYTLVARNQRNRTLRGLIFDGQVTAAGSSRPNVELGSVGSFRDDATESGWSKPYGVNFALTQNCLIADCIFRNFLRAGLRIDSADQAASGTGPPWNTHDRITVSLGNKVLNCCFERNRGIYGDGLLVEECEDVEIADCLACDYQRIGFVFHNASGPDYVSANGVLVTNCVADYGHDAVVRGAQSNAGFWVETSDSVKLIGCESKNTMIGYTLSAAGGRFTGRLRPWTAAHTVTGCSALRCRQQGFRLEYGGAGIHCRLEGCFAEVNRAAAPYADCVGAGPCGAEIDFEPVDSVMAAHIEIVGCAFDMVGCSELTQVAAVNVLNGAVTHPCQCQVTIRDCSSRWLSGGATLASDATIRTHYEATGLGGHDYGYVGDLVFSGANNGGRRFTGSALISNWVDHSFGYCLLSSEIAGADSTLTLENMSVSVRTGGLTSNSGTLRVQHCTLDYRGRVGWSFVSLADCTLADLNGAHKDRSAWGNSSVFQLANCLITRQLRLASNSSRSPAAWPPTLIASGTRWNVDFGAEPGLHIDKPGGHCASVIMNGCVFQHAGGGAPSGNGMIFVASPDQNVRFAGAGNCFDARFVSGAGGHVVTVGAASFDSPESAAGIYAGAFGITMPLG
jgi:hypothetical protein